MTSRFAYFAGLMTPETIQICATWSSCCGKSESLNAKRTMRACALDPALTLPEPTWRAGQCAASAHAAN